MDKDQPAKAGVVAVFPDAEEGEEYILVDVTTQDDKWRRWKAISRKA